MPKLLFPVIALATLLAMELVVALVHRYVMHGFGWVLHRSHHLPSQGRLEANDAYAIIPTVLCILLFLVAGGPGHWLWWLAAGVTAYGFCYGVFHDGIVHRRWPLPWQPRSRYLKRLIVAHHLHHATHERQGAVSYGFLYAPPIEELRARLRRPR